jgi:polysaccharide export outer membrane protein
MKSAFIAVILALGTAAAQEYDEGSYRLDTGDKIDIQVFDEPDLTMTAIISQSGFINYSYLGNIEVAGKTPLQLERELTALLKDGYLVNPAVNITISEYRSFFINGEVARPGGYPYQPGLTLDKAIALAGGLTDRASKRRIYVQRANSDDGSRQKINSSQLVSPGDIINVEEGFF